VTDITLTTEEKQRLEKIDDIIGWRQFIAVKEQFNKVGKLEAFAAAPTDAEKKEQYKLMRGMFGRDAAVSSLKNADIFYQVARRVGTDQELSATLPDGKFEAKDAELLEKCEMKALAALVKLKTTP
jgi:hypothetical protein